MRDIVDVIEEINKLKKKTAKLEKRIVHLEQKLGLREES